MIQSFHRYRWLAVALIGALACSMPMTTVAQAPRHEQKVYRFGQPENSGSPKGYVIPASAETPRRTADKQSDEQSQAFSNAPPQPVRPAVIWFGQSGRNNEKSPASDAGDPVAAPLVEARSKVPRVRVDNVSIRRPSPITNPSWATSEASQTEVDEVADQTDISALRGKTSTHAGDAPAMVPENRHERLQGIVNKLRLESKPLSNPLSNPLEIAELPTEAPRKRVQESSVSQNASPALTISLAPNAMIRLDLLMIVIVGGGLLFMGGLCGTVFFSLIGINRQSAPSVKFDITNNGFAPRVHGDANAETPAVTMMVSQPSEQTKGHQVVPATPYPETRNHPQPIPANESRPVMSEAVMSEDWQPAPKADRNEELKRQQTERESAVSRQMLDQNLDLRVKLNALKGKAA